MTVTVPAEVLKAADALARRLDRSRSWVVAEALRTHTAAASSRPGPRGDAAAVREPASAAYGSASGLGEQRLVQLESDLQLTPEQRIHEAEATVELAHRLHRPPRVAQVLAFGSYEDFLDWKRRDTLW